MKDIEVAFDELLRNVNASLEQLDLLAIALPEQDWRQRKAIIDAKVSILNALEYQDASVAAQEK
jgi:hypothetical protein